MGTNYYIKHPDTGTSLHVGKSSMGHRFCWRVYLDESGPATVQEWLDLFERIDAVEDEYGNMGPCAEFIEMVHRKQKYKVRQSSVPSQYAGTALGTWLMSVDGMDGEWRVMACEFC